MSYHQLQGLASERERELRALASGNRRQRRSHGSGLGIVLRGRGDAAKRSSEASEATATIVPLGAPAANPQPGAMAS